MSRKNGAWWGEWVESFFVVLLIIGFLIAVFAQSVLLNYVIIFLCGLFVGRLMYEEKKTFKFPIYLIIAGFLFGYIIGSYYSDWKMIILIFVVGAIISYYIHYKKYLK